MKFDHELGLALASLLNEMVPQLPPGRVWIKYNKHRIYFNEGQDDNDFTFYLDFSDEEVEVGDLIEEYWLPKLPVDSQNKLKDLAEKAYYKVLFPIEEELPVRTIREMENYSRFECLILEEEEDKYQVSVLPLNYEIELSKEFVKEIEKSPRKKNRKSIHRISIYKDHLDKVISQLRKIEDEEDAKFMAEMTKKAKMAKTVETYNTRSSDIIIDEGETKKCVNCHKEFTYYAGQTSPDFCSTKCKKDFQIVSR